MFVLRAGGIQILDKTASDATCTRWSRSTMKTWNFLRPYNINLSTPQSQTNAHSLPKTATNETWPSSAHPCTQTRHVTNDTPCTPVTSVTCEGCLVNACALHAEHTMCHKGLPPCLTSKCSPQHFSHKSTESGWPGFIKSSGLYQAQSVPKPLRLLLVFHTHSE
jgi:hypothetical protein